MDAYQALNYEWSISHSSIVFFVTPHWWNAIVPPQWSAGQL